MKGCLVFFTQCEICEKFYCARKANQKFCSRRCSNKKDGRPDPNWYRDALVMALVERDGSCCQICNELLDFRTPRELHVDHIIPRHLGGSNHPQNLRLTHRGCNLGREYDENFGDEMIHQAQRITLH